MTLIQNEKWLKSERTSPEGWDSAGGLSYSRPLASQTAWSCVWAPARTWWRSPRQRCSPCPPNAAPAPDETARGPHNSSEQSLELTNTQTRQCSHLGDLRVEVQHVVAQHLSKPTEHFLMPRVVLQIHLGLDLDDAVEEQQRDLEKAPKPSVSERLAPDLAVVYDGRPELLPGLCVVKRASSFTDLHQQRLPLVEIFSQTVVDVLGLHVPQTLVLEPYLTEQTQSDVRTNTLHSLAHSKSRRRYLDVLLHLRDDLLHSVVSFFQRRRTIRHSGQSVPVELLLFW